MVSLKPERLKRYKDVAMLLVKYGRSDLVKRAGLEDGLELNETALAESAPKAEELAVDLEKRNLMRSGAPVVTTIKAWLRVNGGAAAAKAEPMDATWSFCSRFVDWVNAPANNTTTIGTQRNKALLKCLLVACLVCIDAPITLPSVSLPRIKEAAERWPSAAAREQHSS